MGPYMTSAQRAGARKSTSSSCSTPASQVDTTAVRAWAVSNGIELPSRGRVPADVIEKYGLRATIAILVTGGRSQQGPLSALATVRHLLAAYWPH